MSKPIASVRWGLWLAVLVTVAAAGGLRAAEVIPTVPTRYFNDYALTVNPATADKLNRELEDLEKATSNQILVAIYPKLQTESDLADYCHRIFATWHVGQQGKDNGAVLFVFVQDHKMRIETNRGLEGALPDATCKDIISDQIAPRFKANDYDGGLTAGVEAMIAATKGEYKGSGKTAYQQQHANDGQGASQGGGLGIGTIIFLFILFFVISRLFRRGGGGGTMYTGGGPTFFGGGFGGGGFGGGGGGFGGGGGSSDGGGSFSSGGGGSGAGGGASGDW